MSPNPSAPFSTVTFAPFRPVAADLTISGSCSMSIRSNRVALDRMLIEQLPEIVRSAATGLNGANVTVLNGADGLGDIAASLVGQGSAIFEAVRKGFQGGAPNNNRPGAPKGTPEIA